MRNCAEKNMQEEDHCIPSPGQKIFEKKAVPKRHERVFAKLIIFLDRPLW